MLLLTLIQVLVPAAAALWLSFGSPHTRFDLYARMMAAWTALFGIAVAGVWLLVPRITVVALGCLMLTATITAFVRFIVPAKGRLKLYCWLGRLLAAALVCFGAWAGIPAVVGWKSPAETANLKFPFRVGRYIVVNGGMQERINGHFMTLDPRYRRWRGESYAVDLIRVDRAGFRTRARRFFYTPADPAAYLSFGTPVVSPCRGLVEAVETDRPDMPVPVRDRQHLEGNFVRLRCGNDVVFLGHFRRGGIFVQAGNRVLEGQALGEVGNSGNTDEPHLHIHVQTPGTTDEPLSGNPIPLTFNGRFPVRNMIFSRF